jgi:alanyl-tRNA synthetase
MRRAMRHAQLLGARDPLMWRLVWALVREMGQAYPELVRAETLIEETLRLEETRFRKTLDRGLAILDDKSRSLKKGDMFDGETAFTLYDTYGFPLDLTQDALRTRGIGVDIASFTDAMEHQREKARASWAGSGEAATESIWFPLREKLGGTEFLGYETETAEGVRRSGRRYRCHDRRGRYLPRYRDAEESWRRGFRASRHRRAGHAQGRRRLAA